jgi:hypothetical protein
MASESLKRDCIEEYIAEDRCQRIKMVVFVFLALFLSNQHVNDSCQQLRVAILVTVAVIAAIMHSPGQHQHRIYLLATTGIS